MTHAMNWKPGDIAIMVNCYTSKHEGQECEILSCFGFVGSALHDGNITFPGWKVMTIYGEVKVAAKHQLKPLPPANKVTSWQDCIFQPTETVLSE